MYRSATDFLYVNFVSCNHTEFVDYLWAESLGFSLYQIMSSADKDNFTSSFLIPDLFYFMCMSSNSFSCLIALARTSNTMLNTSGGSGHPCLVPDLQGKVSSFYH